MAKAKQSAFVKGLIEKYKQALTNESGLSDQLRRAQKAFDENRETKRLCAALLRRENVDPDSIQIAAAAPSATHAADAKKAERGVSVGGSPATSPPVSAGMNGQEPTGGESDAPLNATHAVYIMMRKHGNAGIRAADLAALSVQEGMPLTSRDVHKVLWTQLKKQRMERTDDGKFRLTPTGEAFTGFRKKADADSLFNAG